MRIAYDDEFFEFEKCDQNESYGFSEIQQRTFHANLGLYHIEYQRFFYINDKQIKSFTLCDISLWI